jgi:hypothetical protein
VLEDIPPGPKNFAVKYEDGSERIFNYEKDTGNGIQIKIGDANYKAGGRKRTHRKRTHRKRTHRKRTHRKRTHRKRTHKRA